MDFTKINPRMTVGCLLCVPTVIATGIDGCVLLQSPASFADFDFVMQAEGWF